MQTICFNAAGGVVVDRDRVLVLRSARYSDLRLPKGHVEEGESPQSAALREVCEESGYAEIEIVADLGGQVVEFDANQTHTIRNERYFLMRLCGSRRIAKAAEDLKFTPEWLDWDEAIAGLVFDEERVWLVKARSLLARRNEGIL